MLTPAYLFSVLALSFLGGTKAAIGPIADLKIVNKVISPDGFDRPTVLSGGTFPGPLVRGTKGDTFKLNVMDALTDNRMVLSTTIHWHGMHQKRHNFADGVAFVTQCPIVANHSFLYEFPVPDQAGTYWYHSHLSTQYCDGLRGAMVVYDPNDPHKHLYDIDDESTVITLADWYHVLAKTPGIHAANSTLINGKGRYIGGDPTVPLSVVGVTQFKRYRFRLVGMTCAVYFIFSIDGHNLTVIEADGENTVPHVVDSLQIHSGQRYSVILNATQPIGNYWIRANPNATSIRGFDGGRNSAILRYAGAPPRDPPIVQKPSVKPLKEVDLHALTNPAAPGKPRIGGADITLPMITGFDGKKFTLNGHSWESPSVPTLLQILNGTQTAQDLLPKGSYYELPRNKVIELYFPGGNNHPFHLHGHSFSVVRSGDSDAYNFKDPVRRDTVSTGAGNGNTTIRFVTDNAGPWILHCHIDWHFELGLAAVMVEDLPNIVKENPVPDAWKDLCPLYNSLPPGQQ